MKMGSVRVLAVSAMLIAVGTLSSHLIWFPAGVAKAFPVQHTINVVAAVVLGPRAAIVIAGAIGVLRNVLGVGTLLAFPGGMFGALAAGLAYRATGRNHLAATGEIAGTGLVGALVSFPVARYLMASPVGALFFIVPFTISSVAGALLALALLEAMPGLRSGSRDKTA